LGEGLRVSPLYISAGYACGYLVATAAAGVACLDKKRWFISSPHPDPLPVGEGISIQNFDWAIALRAHLLSTLIHFHEDRT